MKAIGRQLAAIGAKDNYIAAIVGALAALVAWIHLATNGLGSFYQYEFPPAITLACNSSFQSISPVLETEPNTRKLHAFLNLRTDKFSCEDLPAGRQYYGNLDTFQSASIYLIGSAGLVWTVTGISWSNLKILGAIFVAAFAAGLYKLCRLFIPVPLALFVTVIVILSPMHIDAVPHLRDYSKSPFIIWSLYLAGRAVTQSKKSLYFSCALCGPIAGLGFGFRTDLLLIPLYVGSVILLFILADIRGRWKASLAKGSSSAGWKFRSRVIQQRGAAHSGIGNAYRRREQWEPHLMLTINLGKTPTFYFQYGLTKIISSMDFESQNTNANV